MQLINMNIYDKLYALDYDLFSGTDILRLSISGKYADITSDDNSNIESVICKLNDIPDVPFNVYHGQRVIRKLEGMLRPFRLYRSIDLYMLPLKLLQQMLEDAHNECDNTDELNKIDGISEYDPMNLYGSYLGERSISAYNTDTLKKYKILFRRASSARRMELHKLLKIRNRRQWYRDTNYIAEMGLDYIYGCMIDRIDSVVARKKNINELMVPLPEIDDDYCKRKIHILNTELCYINRNIRAINAELNRRKIINENN